MSQIKCPASFPGHEQGTRSPHSKQVMLLAIDNVEICALLKSVKVK